MGRATLFRRFANREVLLSALALREVRAAIAEVDSQLSRITDPEELLVAPAVAVTRYVRDNRLLQNLLRSDPEEMLPLLTLRGEAVMALGQAYIAGHLMRLRDLGVEIDADLVEPLAEVMGRLTLSIVLNPSTVLPIDDEPRLEEMVRRMFAPLYRRQP